MFKIEKNVPLPEKRFRSANRNKKYPFNEMMIGHSFLVRNPTKKQEVTIRSATFAANRANLNKAFTARKTPEGIRVWRLK